MENKSEKQYLIVQNNLVEIKFNTKSFSVKKKHTHIEKCLKYKKGNYNVYKKTLIGTYMIRTVYYQKTKKIKRWKSLYQTIMKDNKQITIGFGLLCAIIVPIFSLIFFFFGDATVRTISYFGNQGHRLFFIIWGCCTGVLISIFLIRLYNTYKFASSKARMLAVVSCIFLIICVLSPSMYEFPFFSKVHDIMAILFALCTLLSFYFFVMYLKSINKKIGWISLALYASALIFPIITYFIFGHCGVYEIVFFMVFAMFLFCLELLLRKHQSTLFYEIESKQDKTRKIVFDKYKCNGKILKKSGFCKLKGCNHKVKITPITKQIKKKLVYGKLVLDNDFAKILIESGE